MLTKEYHVDKIKSTWVPEHNKEKTAARRFSLLPPLLPVQAIGLDGGIFCEVVPLYPTTDLLSELLAAGVSIDMVA